MPSKVRFLPLLALIAIALSVPRAEAAINRTFRDGDQPTTGYAGTRDVLLSNDESTLIVDGVPDRAALLRFTALPALPGSATLTAASLLIWVVDPSGDKYELYEAKRAWTESGATWKEYAAGSAWTTPGAGSALFDHGFTSIGATPSGTATGLSVEIPFNSTGVNLVSGWITGAVTNNGLLIQNYANSDALEFESSEAATVSHRPALKLTFSNGSTVVLQEGAAGYAGTTDAEIPTRNYNGGALGADGSPVRKSSLMSWDLSSIPAWSTVSSARLVLRVTDVSAASYTVYESLRPWTELTATFREYDTDKPWAALGGDSATDHGTSTLGRVAASSTGSLSVTLFGAGVAVVQGWIRGTRANQGFHVIDYSQSEGAGWADRESATVSNRPALNVIYTEGELAFTTTPLTLDLGSPGGPITVRRQQVGGGSAISTGAPALPITFSTSSTRAGFSLSASPSGTWTPTLTVTIPANGSTAPSVYYRDGLPGAPVITVSAGSAAWNDGSQKQTITTDLISDPFESGTLLTSSLPAGKWSSTSAQSLVTVAANTAAVHRGTYGMEVSDLDTSTASGGEGAVSLLLEPLQGDVHARSWARVTGASTGAGMVLFQYLSNYPATTVGEVVLGSNGFALGSAGFDGSGAWLDDPGTPTAFTTSTWHLVEYSLLGMGTSAGARRIWLDGKLVASRSGIDWSKNSGAVVTLNLGEPWTDNRSFTGKLHFDDFRASTVPLASHLSLAGPGGNLNVNGCVAITASLRDSSADALAPAPYTVSAALTVTGAASGGFFSDAACATARTTVVFAAGASQSTVYYRPTAVGAAQLKATHLDFLEGSTALTVVSGNPLAVSPASASVAPGGTQTFTASGGSGAGYVWSLSTDASGGSVTGAGVYTAGTIGGVTDVVRVVDSLGSSATASVAVTPLLAISPSTTSVGAGQSVAFTATGGVGPYTFSFAANASNGTLSGTGGYTAGTTVNVTDRVQVQDSLGGTAVGTVVVTPGSSLHVAVSGPGTLLAGNEGTYQLQVADGAGNTVSGVHDLTVTLLPVPGNGAIHATFSDSSVGSTGGTQTTGDSDGAGRATVGVSDSSAERLQLCAELTGDAGSRQCNVVVVQAGPADHVRAWAMGSANPGACDAAQLALAVVDAAGNVVESPSTVTLCVAPGRGATIGLTTLAGAARANGCVSGSLPASGTALLSVSDGQQESVDFLPSTSATLPGAAQKATVVWGAPVLSAVRSGFELVNASTPAPLRTGERLKARVIPRDGCGGAIPLISTQVSVQGADPLLVEAPTAETGAFVFPVSLPSCPADSTVPLPLTAHVGGQTVLTPYGVPVAHLVRAICRPPAFTSTPSGEASCGKPYRYSALGWPEVDGDGPFHFDATSEAGTLPEGFSLSPAGEVFWVPTPAQAGAHHLTLRASGPAGSAAQPLEITVRCDAAGCGCGSVEGAALPAFAAAVAITLLARRRRAR